MSKGWEVVLRDVVGPYRWRRDFPGKGFGIVTHNRAAYWWEVWLSTRNEGYVDWDEGQVDTLEKAVRIVEETFDLVGEVDE